MKKFRACGSIGRLRKNKRIRKGMYRYVVTKDYDKENNETKVGKFTAAGQD